MQQRKNKGVAPLAALCVGLAAGVAATGVSAQDAGTKYEYPKARVCDQVDEYFGTKVADPYRWMEIEKTPELEEWIAAENKTTNAYLDQISFRDELRREMTERYDYAKQGMPWKRGGRYFYSKNSGLQNQSTQHFKTSLDGEEKLLIDPNALSDDGTVALSSFEISKDGRYMAYSVSVSGSPFSTSSVIVCAQRSTSVVQMRNSASVGKMRVSSPISVSSSRIFRAFSPPPGKRARTFPPSVWIARAALTDFPAENQRESTARFTASIRRESNSKTCCQDGVSPAARIVFIAWSSFF